jgi:hypothetical protein
MFTRENLLKPYSQSCDAAHLNEFYNTFNPTFILQKS